ncbi:hypothetical protein [Vagococcus humatus]|uniref:Uncharacterized protein n=1 Tax=Vagococcus humatus TaxID=1889241 RepID=A0A3R9YKP9_9ENTE|nr:hypothetical protein [Vagococcus humatus]RST89923.1 hypothetical protein C7P63_02265 [Vagococcus humatus]
MNWLRAHLTKPLLILICLLLLLPGHFLTQRYQIIYIGLVGTFILLIISYLLGGLQLTSLLKAKYRKHPAASDMCHYWGNFFLITSICFFFTITLFLLTPASLHELTLIAMVPTLIAFFKAYHAVKRLVTAHL